jgi:hypothetical protein
MFKMAELKAYKIVLFTESETVGGVVYSKQVYDQADVDKYIADLQSEIERLKKSQESSSKIFDHVNEERIECQKENFIIKRALWLARAKRAQEMAWNFHEKNLVEKCAKWDNVHLMCLAKAEEYK